MSDMKIGIDNDYINTQDMPAINYGLAKKKDKQMSESICDTNRWVMLLTRDVGNLDQRIAATEIKINVFIRPDYEWLK